MAREEDDYPGELLCPHVLLSCTVEEVRWVSRSWPIVLNQPTRLNSAVDVFRLFVGGWGIYMPDTASTTWQYWAESGRQCRLALEPERV